jgi:hypothetical protein
MLIFPIASTALVIANYFAWLLVHMLSSLNFSCSASSAPKNNAIPVPVIVSVDKLVLMIVSFYDFGVVRQVLRSTSMSISFV